MFAVLSVALQGLQPGASRLQTATQGLAPCFVDLPTGQPDGIPFGGPLVKARKRKRRRDDDDVLILFMM